MTPSESYHSQEGATATSKISGFTGIITSRSEHLNGCDRYWIAPRVDKDGKLPDGCWLDDGELEIVPEKSTHPRTNNSVGGFPSSIK